MAGNNIEQKGEALKQRIENDPMRNAIISYLNTAGTATKDEIIAALQDQDAYFPDQETKQIIDPTVVQQQLNILRGNTHGIRAIEENNTRRLKANLDFFSSDELLASLSKTRESTNIEKYKFELLKVINNLDKGTRKSSFSEANEPATSERNILAAVEKNNIQLNVDQPSINTKLHKMMKENLLTKTKVRKFTKREIVTKNEDLDNNKTKDIIRAKGILSQLKKDRAKNIIHLLNDDGPSTMTHVMIKNKYDQQSLASQNLILLNKVGLLAMSKGKTNLRNHYYRINVETIQFIDKMIKEITGKDETSAKDGFTQIEEQFNDN